MPELPPDLVPFVNILGAVVAAVLIGHRYYKSWSASAASQKPPPEVQIVGGALADRTAMRGLEEALLRLAAAIERTIEAQEQRDRDRGHAQEIADLKREIERLRYNR
jgi:hypothetical protein